MLVSVVMLVSVIMLQLCRYVTVVLQISYQLQLINYTDILNLFKCHLLNVEYLQN